ncbi:MAG: low molecular weight phosphotyrosine protein phosphatase, partial [Flavobacteriaceae bacterium]
ENDEVPDPYYGNEDGFKKVFELIDQACDQLSNELQKPQS